MRIQSKLTLLFWAFALSILGVAGLLQAAFEAHALSREQEARRRDAVLRLGRVCEDSLLDDNDLPLANRIDSPRR